MDKLYFCSNCLVIAGQRQCRNIAGIRRNLSKTYIIQLLLKFRESGTITDQHRSKGPLTIRNAASI